MDNLHLRTIIIKLQDRLTDDDRRRLHFFFGNDVPRRIRDDPTLGGTLGLIESLFDQDKINEQDFTYLIEAFEQIKCSDAAKLLREYRQQIQPGDENVSIQSLTSVLPQNSSSVFEESQEDKVAFQNFRETARKLDISSEQNPEIQPNSLNIDSTVPSMTFVNALTNLFRSCATRKSLLISILCISSLLATVVILVAYFSATQLNSQRKIEDSLHQIKSHDENKTHSTEQSYDTTPDPRGFWKKGTKCGCDPWCRQNRPETPYGVCGDGPTCICRTYPKQKATPEEGCTCESWCRDRGHENGGICGDGYTCICS